MSIIVLLEVSSGYFMTSYLQECPRFVDGSLNCNQSDDVSDPAPLVSWPPRCGIMIDQ